MTNQKSIRKWESRKHRMLKHEISHYSSNNIRRPVQLTSINYKKLMNPKMHDSNVFFTQRRNGENIKINKDHNQFSTKTV